MGGTHPRGERSVGDRSFRQPVSEPVAPADCASVAAVKAAVEAVDNQEEAANPAEERLVRWGFALVIKERRRKNITDFYLSGEVCKARKRRKERRSWERVYRTRLVWDENLARFLPIFVRGEE